MPSPARARFYMGILKHLWSQPEVPTPQACAAWIRAQPWEDPPPDLELLMRRLELWPADKPYPPLPDDDELKLGTPDRPDPRWWTPGAKPASPPDAVRKAIDTLR